MEIENKILESEKRIRSLLEQEVGRGNSKISQQHLFNYYQQSIAEGKEIDFKDTGYRVFSQFEEDGKLLFIFSVIGKRTKKFVDIGAWDGVISNCANLLVNFDWKGLFIDGDEERIGYGKQYYSTHPDTIWNRPNFDCSFITRDNVNDIINKHNLSGEIDLLSIDIDGNDYWIWKAIEIINPRVVVIEANLSYGYDSVTIPYNEQFRYKQDGLCGASVSALHKLGKEKGYRLIGSTNGGHNLFFVVDNEASGKFKEVSPNQIVDNICKQNSISSFVDAKKSNLVEV